MVRGLALAALVVAGLAAAPGLALGNGRPPGTSTIAFRQGNESDIAVGLTFGLLISHDAGASWEWVCEAAVGYQGIYDPKFVFTGSGALFATTYDGLKVERDRCTFAAATASSPTPATVLLGPAPDHALYYAASQMADPGSGIAGDFAIYRSTDDGAGFAPTAGQPAGAISWWQSLLAAPSDPRRLYLSGYVYATGTGSAGTARQARLFRSDDGGATWQALPTGDFTVAPNSVIDLVGVWSDDPDHLYARVELDDNTLSDALYRSSDAGMTWHQIRRKNTAIPAFVVRSARNAGQRHDLIAGTVALGAEISHDDGDSWTALPTAPHMGCLVENTAGELWACTQNYGFNGAPTDGAGIMKATDPAAGWTKVLRYEELTKAVTCGAGTVQHDTCAAMWCSVCGQLGCTPESSYACPVATGTEAPIAVPARSGCCDAGPGSAGAVALGLAVGMVVVWPRRRRAQ
jgi:hypothetical protein